MHFKHKKSRNFKQLELFLTVLSGCHDRLLQVNVGLLDERLEQLTPPEEEEIPGHVQLPLQVRPLQDQGVEVAAGSLTDRVHEALKV